METLKAVWAFTLVAALLSSIAEAQNPTGIVHVNGTLYCSLNGRPAAGTHTPVFSNATVQVACTTVVIANAPANVMTNSNGAYRVVLIPTLNATVSSIVSGCKIHVPTHLAACNSSLPASGLVSNLQYVETVPVGFWYITYFVASGFTVQA